jgi:hydroxymethylbilane synthase
MTKITIGSRGSDLALWQANHVKAQLEALGCVVEIKIIKTQGDIIQHLSFDKMEGKGFFTKELESALLDKSIDLAVHSHKDLETNSPAGLIIAAVSEREDPSDLLLIRKEAVNRNEQFNLVAKGVVGTSSARRKAQMMRFRPDVEIKDLRGNVPTRIQKLRDGDYDAILLAHAGVSRLQIDLSEFEVVILDPREFIPAPAQGVLGLQIREEDTPLAQLLQQLDTPDVRRRIGVERAVLNQLDGGCQLPLGVYCPDDHHVYVSFSSNWEEGAIWEEYQVDNLDGVAELIVQDLKEGLEEE